MLTAPVFDTTEPATTADPPELHIVPSPADSEAGVTIPAEPTARIHWIGRFVDYRHPEDLFADIVAGVPTS